jgi:Putative porin
MRKLMVTFLLAALVSPVFAGDDDYSKWLTGWTVKGDLRLRMEKRDADKEGEEDRDRARYRLRISADKKLTDALKVKLRLASGTGDPTSTNDSFDSSFGGKEWRIDKAELEYTSGNWVLHGGKMTNILHSTDIVWDTDVNPEGFFQKYQNKGFYTTLGELFVEESSGDDINLYIAQFGYKGGDKLKYDVSASYYTYETVDGFFETGDSYDFIDLLGTLTYDKLAINVNLVKNNADLGPLGENNDTAWGVFVDYGGNKPGDFSIGLKYAEIEALSVYAPLADSDFGKGDKEGVVVRGNYTANKFLAWSLSIFDVDSIAEVDKGFKLVQLDCSIKF